jgi:hypothetical protein
MNRAQLTSPCARKTSGWTEHERKRYVVRFFMLQGKYTKVGLLVPRCNCGLSEPEMGKG